MKAQGTWEVVRGSGRGDLAGIDGRGGFDAPHGPTATFEFTYELGSR
jgi:hypothetical protein